ncbi:MAG: sigma 54-interacting transcriptional regulator [Myxococcota bacterium]|nr:sigma 54-interacting transcriptional regulator [Myxococcota bacterium]
MTAITLNSARGPISPLLKRAARSSLPILLRGPTGSGKEFAARAIHQASARKGAFIPVNMGALTLGLSQSELFGSVRGSYTGAHTDRAGLFEAAHEGTILLDEIGDAPPHIQVELLRILETKEVRRLGATQATRLDFRIIAATHQPLEHHIAKGTFRADLYYRLQGFEVTLPALNETKADILPLAEKFLREINPNGRLSNGAKERLMTYEWPGNIRELKQTIFRAATLSDNDEIRCTALSLPSKSDGKGPNLTYKTELVGQTYELHGECLKTTAQTLGLHRSTVHRHLLKWKTARLSLTP